MQQFNIKCFFRINFVLKDNSEYTYISLFLLFYSFSHHFLNSFSSSHHISLLTPPLLSFSYSLLSSHLIPSLFSLLFSSLSSSLQSLLLSSHVPFFTYLSHLFPSSSLTIPFFSAPPLSISFLPFAYQALRML